MKRLLTFTLLAAAAAAPLWAQTSLDEIRENPCKAGGVYYAYPVMQDYAVTPAPKGYEPFYIGHFSRHGSRYLIGDQDYVRLHERLRHAAAHDALTPTGLSMLARMDTIWEEAEGRGGELTPLGHRQHRGIGQRMIKHYPQAFAGDAKVFARSTVVMRCAHSMNSFCEGLKEVKPDLRIERESSRRHMGHLNYHTEEAMKFTRKDGPWAEIARKFEAERTKPERLMSLVFSDPKYAHDNVNPHDFMWSVYWVTVDLQNMETPVRFDDILTAEELFNLWQSFNYRFYACNASNPMAGGLLVDCAKPSLRNMLECADCAIAEGRNGADLRFAHDGNLIPLAALMEFDGCCGEELDPYKLHEVYADFKIAPMAGNIQMILFRHKKSGDILVKFLLNEQEQRIPVETDCWPFYHWDDVRPHYQAILDRV